MNPLFKSQEGQVQTLRLYDEKLIDLGHQNNSIYFDTSYGKTHIIVAGNKSKTPIILVHGSNGCAPIALETYADLLDSHLVYAVDVLAQPNKSDGNVLSMKDDSYGRWMNEIIQKLDLDEVKMAGFSFGGLVILKTLIHDESKIKSAYLSAPAFIVNGNPLKALIKLFMPMKRFIKTKKEKYLDRFLDSVFTKKDKFAHQYISTVLTHFTMDFTPVPVIKRREAAKITTPITLFAAENDVIFPGPKMIKRARQIFPSLQESILLKKSKHVQNKQDNSFISSIILKG